MRTPHGPTGLSHAAAQVTLRWAPGFDPAIAYRGRSASWALNAFKGTFGEEILERGVTSGLFERARPAWMSLTPHRIGDKGIDALFVKVGRDGSLRGVMVADAKFQSARQIHTRTGQQMSYGWVRPRLLATASEYGRAANALRDGGVRTARAVGRRMLRVPIGDGKSVGVWCGASGLRASAPVNSAWLRRQLRRIDETLRAAAQSGRYAARLLKVGVSKDQFDFALQRLDVQTGKNLGRQHLIRGPWRKLGKDARTVLDRCMRANFARHFSREADIDALCRAARRDPSLLLNLRTAPRSLWLVGIDTRMARIALGAGGAAMLLSLVRSAWRGDASLRHALKEGALAGGSAATTYLIFAQVQTRLATTAGREIARALPLRAVNGSAVMGAAGLAASIGAGIAVAVGAYALGLVDVRQARVTGVAGFAGAVASALVPAGAFGAATAFGTAGTGVAIGTLSGAAYNSAALAYIGGLGGGGVAAGSAVLTGGAAVVGFAVVAGVHAAVARLDRIERRRLIEARLELVEQLLRSSPAPQPALAP